MMWLVLLFPILTLGFGVNTKPHIIVILADDLGWNDVGFHGSNEIPTPNIDALAYNGVILNSHYVQALCTPSRAAFLTGKYPIHTGMQHSVLLEPEPRGLSIEEKLLPQHLRENGYSTHAVGKWHLGFFEKQYTPTYRGFDTHYGYYQGVKDYYTHMVHATMTKEVGYDIRRNLEIDWEAQGKYSTDLFTEEAINVISQHNTTKPMFLYLSHLAVHSGNADNPLQAPDEEIAKFLHIDDPERRIYAAMTSILDKSVGKVMMALRKKQMLENSVVLFMADNGAQTVGRYHANHGSNYPLKGLKNSPWEGGTRGVAAIWSPFIKKPQRISNRLMHITDWLPTFYSIAGLNVSDLKNIDGFDMWNSISEDAESTRTEMVYNIDEIENYAAVRRGEWKYVHGTTAIGELDSWYGSTGKNKNYTYDESTILMSEVGSALAGYITSVQIQEKHANKLKSISEEHYNNKLLNINKISTLRKSAALDCGTVDSDNLHENSKCRPLESPCLFNIKDDPCEMVNLAKERPILVQNLEEMLLKIKKTMIPARNVKVDPNANPIHWNNTWISWQEPLEIQKYQSFEMKSWTLLAISLIGAACLLFVILLILIITHTIRRNSKNILNPITQGPFSIYVAKQSSEKSEAFEEEKDT
ncbi:hypothetical protein FQA39_LY08574 [Lamprigera yunnana]|nr:hypothetical protein FQA39_LY08574 [Lamprigera yunnana]